MYKIIASMFVGMALSACGGTNSSYANLSTVVTNFSDGSGVAIARFPVNRSYAYVNEVMLINDINDANRIADGLQRANNGQLILVVPDRIPGSYYAERSQGLSSFGEDVDLIYEGKSLDGGGFVSTGMIQVGSSVGVVAGGSQLITRPVSGTFRYNGSSTFYGVSSNPAGEKGTMSVVADFDIKTASLTLQSASGFATGNDLAIDFVNGFLTGQGTIGRTGVSSDAATIKGYFAGQSAEGVYGAVYENSDVSDGKVATFYGSK